MTGKVLLTGGTGFIGRHAPTLLRELGCEVLAPQAHELDLMDPKAVTGYLERERPTLLLHFAWYTEHGKFWASPLNEDWKTATLHLAGEFCRLGGKRALLAGTCAEYAWGGTEPLSEGRSPLAPGTVYGQVKNATRIAAEKICSDYGVELAWGRIFLLYGPHEGRARLVPAIIVPLLENRVAEFTEGTQVRDFMHAEDVARGFVHVLLSKHQGPINIASGQGVSLRQVIEKTASILGKPELVRLGARPMPPNDPPSVVADASKLRALGFKPKYDLESGLRATIEWWKEQL